MSEAILHAHAATGGDMDELRKPVLANACSTAIIAGWLWIIVVGAVGHYPPPLRVLAPPVVLAAASALSLLHDEWHIKWRSALFVFGLTAALILGRLGSSSPMWLYYQVLVVSISGLLAGPTASFPIAIVLTAVTLLGARSGPEPLGLIGVLPPLGLLWLTAVVTSLSTRSLYMALWWAMDSQASAWATTLEVRRRRAELRRALDSLTMTHELLERTTHELDLARREAEQARQVKSRFVANISHELRTPLNIIVGFAEMLCTSPEAYDTSNWPPALRGDLLTIWRNAEHLLGMVDDVLDLAQIEAARLPILPEPTELTPFIRNTLTTASALLRDSRLNLEVSLPAQSIVVELDRTRIRQVLLNMINNAVRYTPEGYIEVGAWATAEEVTVYVRDSGIGIPEDKLEVIFQEFEQAATSLGKQQGVGLGLAISRHFVQLHGGRIWAESRVGEGSTFYFTLPVLPPPGAVTSHRLQRTRAVAERQMPGGDTIVAQCRDRSVVRILERHMEDATLVATNSVDETIAAIGQWHPHAVLLTAGDDVELPAALRQAETIVSAVEPFDIPVFACSFPTERCAAAALGAADFLIKPVVRKDVIPAIQRICAAPRCILAVDDDPNILALLERMIAQQWPNCRVLTATSGREAVALARKRPDVILLELLLPDASGAEVLDALREDAHTAAIPAIIIAARGLAVDLAEHQRGRVHIVKRKSLTAMELVQCLSALAKSLPARYVSDTVPEDTR